jgi:hypothetical protein
MKDYISAFDEIHDDEYTEATDARELGRLLIERVDEHSHLRDATIGYLFRDDELTRHGKVTVAEAILVERILPSDKRWSRLVKWSIQHHVLHTATLPDFLVLIDRHLWAGFDAEQKLALVDHELMHASQANDENGSPKFHKDGRPVWSIRGHDVEEFAGTVERHGLWNEELVVFARTIVDRLATEERQRIPRAV